MINNLYKVHFDAVKDKETNERYKAYYYVVAEDEFDAIDILKVEIEDYQIDPHITKAKLFDMECLTRW